ncbi:MAG: hypothetical protein LBV02_08160 [Bacteroidales bacterium]|jgi:hypothetical protein|nr:hypothetical protein [Bacteroidales bacterium]
MKKINLIEKKIDDFNKFSINVIGDIIGGDMVKCNGSSTTLYCTPFGVGSCLSVTIGDVTYECSLTASLKEGPCVKSILPKSDRMPQMTVTHF